MEGDIDVLMTYVDGIISIHSLRMEGDKLTMATVYLHMIISIHSLRMEGDMFLIPVVLMPMYFNPLPPYGGRRLVSTAV